MPERPERLDRPCQFVHEIVVDGPISGARSTDGYAHVVVPGRVKTVQYMTIYDLWRVRPSGPSLTTALLAIFSPLPLLLPLLPTALEDVRSYSRTYGLDGITPTCPERGAHVDDIITSVG